MNKSIRRQCALPRVRDNGSAARTLGEANTAELSGLQNRVEWKLSNEDGKNCRGLPCTVLGLSRCQCSGLNRLMTVPSFERLSVLCLKDTGLVDIGLLRPCARLVYLDLSSNEIVDLVGGDFWESFPQLLVLLMHENKVMEWQNTASLSRAPVLTYLTMFSNPICKMRTYRTFMVNCCAFLRGMDRHAVSDEEVIQEIRFFEKSLHKTCSPTLALPHVLFTGLMEVTVSEKGHGDRPRSTGEALSDYDGDINYSSIGTCPDQEETCMRVVLRVRLLRRFHASQSPVIICQRYVRRFIRYRIRALNAVKIQACVRSWLVRRRATEQLKSLLQISGELYLVQEMMTPLQLRNVCIFQRHILGFVRRRVRETSARKVWCFMFRMWKRFSAIAMCIDRAQIREVVVAAHNVDKLTSAVASALGLRENSMAGDRAMERAKEEVAIFPHCKILRSFSYVEVPDWPMLREDINTDGIFVLQSVSRDACDGRARQLTTKALCSTGKNTARSPSDGYGRRSDMPAVRRLGLFSEARVSGCRIRRRCALFRSLLGDKVRAGGASSTRDTWERLYTYRTSDCRILARVLHTLHNGGISSSPVPYIFPHHLIRCAAATRVQAVWRGYVSRWNVLLPLATCLILERATVCLQRWWRYVTGIGERLRLSRRLWALASAISTPVMYMELDVYFVLTRGWRNTNNIEEDIFCFQGDCKAVHLLDSSGECMNLHSRRESDDGTSNSACKTKQSLHGTAIQTNAPAGGRRLPLWALTKAIPSTVASDVCKTMSSHNIGALLTENVEVKLVVWPLAARVIESSHLTIERGREDGVSIAPQRVDEDIVNFPQIVGNDIETSCIIGESDDITESCVARVAGKEQRQTIDLRKILANSDMLELSFTSVQEARKRAILLAFATEEPGKGRNRPVAQLMTFEMLCKAAAEKHGTAVSTFSRPLTDYKPGNSVEVQMTSDSGLKGRSHPGILNRDHGDGNFQVALDRGDIHNRAEEYCLRSHDRTGKENGFLEMSHLPSSWQRSSKSHLAPEDFAEFQLLRRSLPTTSPVSEAPVDGIHVKLVYDTNANTYRGSGHPIDIFDYMDGVQVNQLKHVQRPRGSRFGAQIRANIPRTLQSAPCRQDMTPNRRWASSDQISKVTAGRLASGARGRSPGAAVANVAGTGNATTWVPGEQFREYLENLVNHEVLDPQDASKLEGIHVEHEVHNDSKLATQTAVCQREASRYKVEKQIVSYIVGSNCALMAKSKESDSPGASKSREEIGQREGVSPENRQTEDTREMSWGTPTIHAQRQPKCRASRALAGAEGATFTSESSTFASRPQARSVVGHNNRDTKHSRTWVKGQRATQEELRWRLLKRVRRLQEQQRMEAMHQHKVPAGHNKWKTLLKDALPHDCRRDPDVFEDKRACASVLAPETWRRGCNWWRPSTVHCCRYDQNCPPSALWSSDLDGQKNRSQAGEFRVNNEIGSAGALPIRSHSFQTRLRQQGNRRARSNKSTKIVKAAERVELMGSPAGALFDSRKNPSTAVQRMGTGGETSSASTVDLWKMPWPMGRQYW